MPPGGNLAILVGHKGAGMATPDDQRAMDAGGAPHALERFLGGVEIGRHGPSAVYLLRQTEGRYMPAIMLPASEEISLLDAAELPDVFAQGIFHQRAAHLAGDLVAGPLAAAGHDEHACPLRHVGSAQDATDRAEMRKYLGEKMRMARRNKARPRYELALVEPEQIGRGIGIELVPLAAVRRSFAPTAFIHIDAVPPSEEAVELFRVERAIAACYDMDVDHPSGLLRQTRIEGYRGMTEAIRYKVWGLTSGVDFATANALGDRLDRRGDIELAPHLA